MPTFDVKARAAELQRQLATLTGHDHAGVRPYGKHLLIQMRRDSEDTVDTIARITEQGRQLLLISLPKPHRSMGAIAWHWHTGRNR